MKHVSYSPSRFARHLTLVTAMLALSACAGYAPSKDIIGLSRTQVIERLGPPGPAPEDLASAKRLDFPRGPFGKHTYSVYFDDSGNATGYRQLLTEENFAKVRPGMPENDVVELIGIAKDRFSLARNRGYVWNYRYFNHFCQWFQIEFTAERTVRSSGYGKPPECRIPPALAG